MPLALPAKKPGFVMQKLAFCAESKMIYYRHM